VRIDDLVAGFEHRRSLRGWNVTGQDIAWSGADPL